MMHGVSHKRRHLQRAVMVAVAAVFALVLAGTAVADGGTPSTAAAAAVSSPLPGEPLDVEPAVLPGATGPHWTVVPVTCGDGSQPSCDGRRSSRSKARTPGYPTVRLGSPQKASISAAISCTAGEPWNTGSASA